MWYDTISRQETTLLSFSTKKSLDEDVLASCCSNMFTHAVTVTDISFVSLRFILLNGQRKMKYFRPSFKFEGQLKYFYQLNFSLKYSKTLRRPGLIHTLLSQGNDWVDLKQFIPHIPPHFWTLGRLLPSFARF